MLDVGHRVRSAAPAGQMKSVPFPLFGPYCADKLLISRLVGLLVILHNNLHQRRVRPLALGAYHWASGLNMHAGNLVTGGCLVSKRTTI